MSGQSRASRRWIVPATAFVFEYQAASVCCSRGEMVGPQVAEASESAQVYKLPAVIPQPVEAPGGPSNRRTVIMVSLAALSVLGAAVSSLPASDRFDWTNVSWSNLELPAVPNFDRLTASLSWPELSLPDLSLPHLSWPDFSRLAAAKPKPAPPAMPDPALMAALTEIQVSQRQSAVVLAGLTESAAAQQAELKKLSRQVTLVSVQMDSLRGTVTLTSSIPAAAPSNPLQAAAPPSPSMFTDDPMTASINPATNASARVVRPARKTSHVPAPPAPAPATPTIPKPVGPVSVGGAPLGAESGT